MPRIVIDARESGTSTGRYVDKLIENLAEIAPADLEFIVLTKTPRRDYLKKIAPNFEVIVSDFKEFTFDEQLGFARQLYSLRPDLVHFSMTQQPLLYLKRSVTTVHDLTTLRFTNPAKNWLVYKIKQQVYNFVLLWAAHKSKRLIAISEYVKRDLARHTWVRLAKIDVIYEAADKITGSPKPMANLKNKQFLMYVGRPQPHKNLPRLIKAFENLQRSHPDLCLVLAGRKDAVYEKLARSTTPNLIFTDFISDAQLKWLYENCAAYIFPSLSEGFGLPGLEAMMHGAPVVASNCTCLPEVYGKGAHYLDPRDVGDMTKQIERVLNEPALRNELIKAGHTQAQKYSWRDTAKQTLEFYRRALR